MAHFKCLVCSNEQKKIMTTSGHSFAHATTGRSEREGVTGLKTRFTDAGASSGLSRTSREVMTTVQGVKYVFGHKTLYLLIHVPYTRIVAFWHIGNVPPMIS